MDIKAQGALEYLIIIAAVLAIAAIIVTILTGILGGRQEAQLVTEAQEAASKCNQALVFNNEEPGEVDSTTASNICGSICDGDWVDSDTVGTTSDADNPEEACQQGMPGWIVEAG